MFIIILVIGLLRNKFCHSLYPLRIWFIDSSDIGITNALYRFLFWETSFVPYTYRVHYALYSILHTFEFVEVAIITSHPIFKSKIEGFFSMQAFLICS